MAIPSGIAAQIGFVAESGYGVAGTVSRFLEFNSEAIKPELAQVTTRGLGRGRFERTGRTKTSIIGAAGPIELDLMTLGFGLLLKHCLGGYANTSVAGSERKALNTPAAAARAGLSLTTQVGRPDTGGTVRPFTYAGTKIKTWEIKNSNDDRVILALDVDAKGETTGTALASASFIAGAEHFVASECAATLDGSAIFVDDFSIKGENAEHFARRGLGNVKKEPIANGEEMITGSLGGEFEDLARHGQWVAGTEIEDLVLTWTTPTAISGGGTFLFSITVPLIRITSAPVAVGGPDVVQQPLEFKCLDNGTDPVITLEQRTTESAA